MIQKLKDTQGMYGYRSFLDTRTGDVIIQGKDIDWHGFEVHWEVIVRGSTERVDARHIDCKREVVKRLKSPTDPTQYDAERLSENTLDGIIRDYANAHKQKVL